MKYRRILPLIVFAIIVSVFILLDGPAQPLPAKNNISTSKEAVKVLKVVDGDTIKVLIGKKEESVRLIGIDSPEVLDEKKTIQCYGKEASEKAKEILSNKTIILESDSTQSDRDEYGRLLRYVFIDGKNFNRLMLSEGFAREYTFKGNPYEYQKEFIRAQEEARQGRKGLWSECAK
jgi:micrococcal nuclease